MTERGHHHWPSKGRGHALIIGIAGGSGSGKTTVAEAVVETLTDQDAVIIEHDAYYRDHPELSLEQRAGLNYDHPDAFETELLVEHLDRLRRGGSIDKPIYDFASHRRTGVVEKVNPASVVVVEGILVLAEPELRDLMDLKIFVDTDADLRFVRRLRRDVKERNRSPESVMDQYLTTVRPMHLQFVEESKRYADIIIPEGYNPPAVGTVISMIRDYLSRR